MTSIPAVTFGERYPHSIELADGRVFELRLMGRADRYKVIDFGRPRGDVPSIAVDITDPQAIDQWISEIESGRATTILALERGAVVAYASLHRDGALWKQHAGEVETMVARSCRGVGLGARMVAEAIVIANGLGLKRVTTGVAADRKASLAMYERVGFQPEALLTDYLIDPWDETHDLVIMSCDVARAASTLFAEELALLDARADEEPVTTSTGQPEAEVEVVAASIEIYAGAAASACPVEETVSASEMNPAESDAVAAHVKVHAPACVRARPREEPAPAAAAAMRAVDALAAFAGREAPHEGNVPDVEEPAIVTDPSAAGSDAMYVESHGAPGAVAQTTADDQARAVRLAGGRHAGRMRFRDVALLRAVAAIAVFSAAGAGAFYALESRGGGNESQVLPASTSPTREGSARALTASFIGSSVGSGRMVIPAAPPRVSLQVSLDSATVTGTWFWCFESSFGLSWQEHYCSATGALDAQTGLLVTEGIVPIDPAWPGGAEYFIQMYCESDCAWQTTVRQQ